MTRVVALVQSMTAEQDKAFVAFVSGKAWGYWHWIDGAWLLDTFEEPTAVKVVEIRDFLHRLAPEKFVMVFEVTGVSRQYAGFGPNAKDHNMVDWLTQHWFDKPDA